MKPDTSPLVTAPSPPQPQPHPHPRGDEPAEREVILVTGTSGSGKSVVLRALEDVGFFCVDNLPPELLRDFLALGNARFGRRVAVAVDARSAESLPRLRTLLQDLAGEGIVIRTLFLDATTEALVRRFSESRRPHPLSGHLPSARGDAAAGAGPAFPSTDPTGTDASGRRVLVEAIEFERELLADLRQDATVMDTSQLRPVQLRLWVRDLVRATGSRLTLVFESFAFKNGVPLDADFVFDVRVLPNPHYLPDLKPLTGRDAPVIEFLERESAVHEMLEHIAGFLRRWLPAFEDDQRSYLTVGIGCTGGQHRSVYLAERLAAAFRDEIFTLVRHREQDARLPEAP